MSQADTLADPDSVNVRWNRQLWRRWLLPPLALLLLIGMLVGVADGGYSVDGYWQLQRSLFLWLNATFNQLPAAFWYSLTLLGDAGVSLPIFALLFIKHPRAGAALLGAVPLALLLAIGGKELLEVPRPAAVIDPSQFQVIGELLRYRNSLPSGHSITIATLMFAALASLLAQPRSRSDWSWLLAGSLFALTVCLSRVAVGAHWPLDTLTGLALGWLSGLSGVALAQRGNWWRSLSGLRGRYPLGMILLLWSIALGYRALFEDDFSTLMLWVAALCAALVAYSLLHTPTYLTARRLA